MPSDRTCRPRPPDRGGGRSARDRARKVRKRTGTLPHLRGHGIYEGRGREPGGADAFFLGQLGSPASTGREPEKRHRGSPRGPPDTSVPPHSAPPTCSGVCRGSGGAGVTHQAKPRHPSAEAETSRVRRTKQSFSSGSGTDGHRVHIGSSEGRG